MAVLKLSQIASSPANPVGADTFVGVHGGNTDYQFTLTQLIAGIGAAGGFALTINTTTITGGTSGNFLYDNAGTVGERTPTQATASLNLFTNTLQGLVPGSGGGTTNFLRADGTWSAPAGGGGTPGGANTDVQFNNTGAFGGDSGFTYAGNGQATLALGTITSNEKALNITGTWNAVGVTFDAPLFMNITNTASAANSILADIQQGGTSQLALFNRTASAASPTLALGNGANPTQLFVYNTVDTLNNPTNYERLALDFGVTLANIATIGTQAGGTGTAGRGFQISVYPSATARLSFNIDSSSQWAFNTGNAGLGGAVFFAQFQRIAIGTTSGGITAGIQCGNANYMGFASSASASGVNSDTTLFRDAAVGVLALGDFDSNTTATGLRVYKTTDNVSTNTAPTNYECGAFDWTTTASVLTIGTQAGGTGTLRPTNIIGADIVVGTAALATNATDGFLYIPTCAGTPTGTPTTFTGRVPMVFDTTNSQFWFFTGGAWKQPKTPAAAAIVTWQ